MDTRVSPVLLHSHSLGAYLALATTVHDSRVTPLGEASGARNKENGADSYSTRHMTRRFRS